MTSNALLLRAAVVLAAGGLAWLAKLAVIAATDGEVTSTGAAAVLYLLGALLMPAGLAGVGVAITAGRRVPLRAAAAMMGVLAFLGCFAVLDSLAVGVVGDAGPSWLGDEAGILVTGAALAAAGLLTASSAQQTVA